MYTEYNVTMLIGTCSKCNLCTQSPDHYVALPVNTKLTIQIEGVKVGTTNLTIQMERVKVGTTNLTIQMERVKVVNTNLTVHIEG